MPKPCGRENRWWVMAVSDGAVMSSSCCAVGPLLLDLPGRRDGGEGRAVRPLQLFESFGTPGTQEMPCKVGHLKQSRESTSADRYKRAASSASKTLPTSRPDTPCSKFSHVPCQDDILLGCYPAPQLTIACAYEPVTFSRWSSCQSLSVCLQHTPA